MINRFKLLLLAVVAISFFAACKNDSAVKDEARNALENPGAVTPQPVAGTDESAAAIAAPTGPTTEMTFEETEFDYGTINEGEVITHNFKFKNTGKEPLIISNAKGSCGCTVPKWPREPIAPGATGEVNVEFNSQGKPGTQTKKVTITANTNPPQSFLTINGTVNKKGGDAAPAKQ